jgi:hypothetical protein
MVELELDVEEPMQVEIPADVNSWDDLKKQLDIHAYMVPTPISTLPCTLGMGYGLSGTTKMPKSSNTTLICYANTISIVISVRGEQHAD